MATITPTEAASALRSLADAIDALGEEILGPSVTLLAHVHLPTSSGIPEARRIEIVTGANRLLGHESTLRPLAHFAPEALGAPVSFTTSAPDAYRDHLIAERQTELAAAADAAFSEVAR